MSSMKIDGAKVALEGGETVLEAARSIGTIIPTMCHLQGYPQFTSCMVCMVEDMDSGELMPACSTLASEGMEILTLSDKAVTSRRHALELMLSEHIGDCDAPCYRVCPAKIDIPRMLRLIAEFRPEEATAVVRAAIGEGSDSPCANCNGRCEKACRRRQHDSAVSIKLLVEFALRHASSDFESTQAQPTGERFNCNMGRVSEREMQTFLAHASTAERLTPVRGDDEGFTDEEASAEVLRCLHCDCRKRDNCRLRDLATEYDAHQRRFAYASRRNCEIIEASSGIIYEPGKCVKCGICIRIAEAHREPLGLAFIGRGFDVMVGVPFDEELGRALTTTAKECVEACPTAALAFDDFPVSDNTTSYDCRFQSK